MALTLAQLTANLASAQAAYHNLMTGKSVKVVVDQNGERVEYNSANSSRLAQYIAELERLIAGTPSGPLNVWM